MKNDKDDKNANQHWCQHFAGEALERDATELEAFHVVGNQTPLAAQRKLAGAALTIVWTVINEVGGLLVERTVQASRDNIITGLCDILRNGYEDTDVHLGHDIVDAIADALGEYSTREGSVYDWWPAEVSFPCCSIACIKCWR